MSSLNKVTLIGNVGQDLELKETANGSTYVRISLATTESWKDKTTGQKKEYTTWHNLKFYDQLAHTCMQYVKKGSKIYVEGSLRTSEYEKNGVKHKFTEIICKHLVLLGERAATVSTDFESAPFPHPIQKTLTSMPSNNSYNVPQRPLEELVQFDPKVNPLRNITKPMPKSSNDFFNDDIPF
ncbi:single-stranded DNA-binding protein [Candidatus Odyssella acanthamoebae]|uniref:single-stranded DNA-binding protein n=1 Tax=Candidatus Odyssella acanthamoebae TaxID=91604 RepID=UPI00069110B2|nr:single-stranded DNA-binding protein [Candidatus Paracaedibacter acanthamoebae]